MKIVNPLYDNAFKYLMQNNKLAKKVLSTILDQEIEELSLSQQETIVHDEKRYLTLFRLDFKATILTETGERQTVLIELQKSKYSTDIQRFRNYLGSAYMAAESKKAENDNPESNSETEITEKGIYPIITIYILGYSLKDVPHLAVTVDRLITDSVSKKPLEIDSFFINHLTHRSHILQVKRLPPERRTRLERFMILFNQAWITEKKYIIDLHEIPEEFRDIAQHLQVPVMDESFRRKLEAEEEIDNAFNAQEAKYQQKIKEAEDQLEKERQEKEAAKAREKEAKAREEEAQQKLARKMLKYDEPIDEIIKETGLTREEIENL